MNEQYKDVLFVEQPIPTLEEKPLYNKKILLVEDDMINALVAKKFLVKWGASVDHVMNGKEAVDLVRSNKNKYHLLIMDVFMPVMDGAEATRFVRNDLGMSKDKLPIIASTAMLKSEASNITDEELMNGFISKPFVPDEMLKLILKHIH